MRVERASPTVGATATACASAWSTSAQRCQTSVAATASCPSRHTVAVTGTTSPTTAFDGNRPPETSGLTSSIPRRPCARRVRSEATGSVAGVGVGRSTSGVGSAWVNRSIDAFHPFDRLITFTLKKRHE